MSSATVRRSQPRWTERRPLAALPSDESLERPLPHNLEAERAIVGAIMLDNAALTEAIKCGISPADFSLPQHRCIYARQMDLASRRIAIDIVTLHEELSRHGELEAAGGTGYVSALADGLPKVGNVPFYARIVKDKAILRSVIHSAAAVYEEAFSTDAEADEVLERVGSIISDISSQSAHHTLDWREKFHTVDQLADGDADFLIDRVLPTGVVFIGGLSGVGKTWFALSMVRALIHQRNFLGVYPVAFPQNVLYLCPEMNAKSFRRRCERFGIGGERFRCLTIADGVPIDLDDPILLSAIRELQPVLFLDTAIRFSAADDENSASENAKGLAPAIFSLLHAGAKAVVCLHHRGKNSGNDEMTLENALRGTSDLGAICDAVWGLQYDRGNSPQHLAESRKLVRLSVRCVKARDFAPPDEFRIQLDPFLDETGDLGVLTDDDPFAETEAELETRLAETIRANLSVSKRQLEKLTGIGRNRVETVAAKFGLEFGELGWKQSGGAV